MALLVTGDTASASKTQAVPAKLAIAPVRISVANIGIDADQKNIASKLSEVLSSEIERLMRERGVFSGVATISSQDVSTAASVAELALAAREKGADIVLDTRIVDFEGHVSYGFSTKLMESMTVETTLYESQSGQRLWFRKEKVGVERRGSVGSWNNEMIERKFIALAQEEALPAAITVLAGHMRQDMADYKPPTQEKAAVVTAEFLADVDRVPRTATEEKKDAYAIVIGIENYRDLPPAEFAVRDARIIREYLIRVMGFPQENIVALSDGRATRADIEGYVGTWLKNGVNEKSFVFIYYAGHGAPNPVTGEPFLIPYDGNPALLEASALPLKRFYQALASIPAKEVLVVMDACFSGGGGRSVMAKGGRPIALSVENPLLASKNVIVMSAAKGTEISSSYPEKKHGLFTYFFLKGLQGDADLTGDKVINIEKLYNYVTQNVKKVARQANREQTPVIAPDIDVIGMRARMPLTASGK
jgi:hypothetical protein